MFSLPIDSVHGIVYHKTITSDHTNQPHDRPIRPERTRTMKNYTTEHLNYGNSTVNGDELRSLCIREEYFTCGDCTAYDKLFKLNDNGASIEILAACIWSNSGDWADLDTIAEQIRDLNRWPIHLDSIRRALESEGFGETEIEIITEAVRTHQDAGTAYKVIESVQ